MRIAKTSLRFGGRLMRIGNGKCEGVDRMGHEYRGRSDAGEEWGASWTAGVANCEGGMSRYST